MRDSVSDTRRAPIGRSSQPEANRAAHRRARARRRKVEPGACREAQATEGGGRDEEEEEEQAEEERRGRRRQSTQVDPRVSVLLACPFRSRLPRWRTLCRAAAVWVNRGIAFPSVVPRHEEQCRACRAHYRITGETECGATRADIYGRPRRGSIMI